MRKPRAAFVVEVDAESGSPGGQLQGRVEHVITGASHDFESTAALVRFIERMMSPQPPAGGAGRTS